MRRTWRPGSHRGVRREAEDTWSRNSGRAERGQDSLRYLGARDPADRKSWGSQDCVSSPRLTWNVIQGRSQGPSWEAMDG